MQAVIMYSCILIVIIVIPVYSEVDSNAEIDAQKLLQDYDTEITPIFTSMIKLAWNYNTNITEYNRKTKEKSDLEMLEIRAGWYEKSRQFANKQLSIETRRTMKKAFPAQLDPVDAKNLSSIMSNMSQVYATATVCLQDDKDECLSLDPGLSRLMATSKNYTTLSYIWHQWRNNVGRKIRNEYLQYLELMNKQATLDNYTDAGQMWRDRYESASFENDMVQLYEELSPLYKLVHSYVRHKLTNVYKEQIDVKGALPACVLGDMWGRFWMNIYALVTPYPDEPDIDVTNEMINKNYTVLKMFKMADEFFTSMGLKEVPENFWSNSMLERPTDGRNVMCHPTAWDFRDGKDFRIKMCSKVNMEDLMTIHHELGHIQYFMQYAHQHVTHRDGANDGFHEAIGELIAMVMSTPKHLQKINLLHNYQQSKESTINYLMRTALHTITTLPFHLVNDLWRWRLWRGEYQNKNTYNDQFWKLKEYYLGVKPPVPRDDLDLDPPSLFHIATSYDMIRYFTRTVLQFQFLESLCNAAGHDGPLYTCDIHGSHQAGQLLASGLALGSSLPWQDVLEQMTGQRRMNTSPMIRYFEPLSEWLKEHNQQHNLGVGWGDQWTLLKGDTTADSGSFGRCGSFLIIVSAMLVMLVW